MTQDFKSRCRALGWNFEQRCQAIGGDDAALVKWVALYDWTLEKLGPDRYRLVCDDRWLDEMLSFDGVRLSDDVLSREEALKIIATTECCDDVADYDWDVR